MQLYPNLQQENVEEISKQQQTLNIGMAPV